MNNEHGIWSLFKDGACTGVVFSGTQAGLLLNLPAGQVATAGAFSPGDPLPPGAEVIQSTKDE